MYLIKKFKAKLMASSFWNSVVTLSAGQIIGQLITLFSTPIVSRLYSSNEYGSYGIITSTATIIIGFIGLGLNSAIMMSADDKEAKKIFSHTFLLQATLATIFVAGMLLVAPYKMFFQTSLPYYISVLFMYVYILSTNMCSLLCVYINRLKKNKVLFFNPLIAALCTLFITIPLGLLHCDFIGLMIAGIFSTILSCIHMIRNGNPFYEIPSFKNIGWLFKKYRQFIVYQYPANLMGTFCSQLPNQTLSNQFGNAALGSFAMCNRLFAFPMNLIAVPIQTVYFRTAVEKHKKGEDLSAFTFSLVSKICLLGFIPVVILMMFGENIFGFVLGNSWREAGAMAGVLVLQYVFTFCENCITYCRVSIGKQKINLLASLLHLIIILISLLLGVLCTDSLMGVISFFAVANTLWQIVNIGVSFICLKKKYVQWFFFSIGYSLLCLLCYIFTHYII